MKIYNEVTIDMNPESSNYGEVLSESSYNYEGNVALCCGGTKKMHLQDKGVGSRTEGSLGYQAWGLGAGHDTQGENPFGGTRMAHPETLPGFFNEAGRLSGVEAVGGRDVGSTITPFNPNQAATTGGSKSFLGMRVGSRATNQGNLAAEAQRYGSQFKSRWYDPYIQTAITDPAKEAVQAYTMTAQDKFGGAMPEGILQGYTGPRGDFAYNNQVIVGGKQAGTAGAEARTDLEIAGAGYEADMRSADLLAAGYTKSEQRIEEDLVKAEEDKVSALENAQRSREDARKGLATERGGQIPTGFGVQKAYAPMAKSGFATSGPIQSQIQAGEEKTIDKFREATAKGRMGERKYQDAIDSIEKGFTETQETAARDTADYAEKRLALQQQREGYARDFDASKRAYGGDIQSLADTASEELTDVGTWISDLTKGHERFGEAIQSKSKLPGTDYGYKLRNTGLAKTVGTTAYDAPGGGWFSESAEMEGIGGAQSDLEAARGFSDYLGTKTVDQILGAEFGEGWEGKDPTQLGLGTDSGEG